MDKKKIVKTAAIMVIGTGMSGLLSNVKNSVEPKDSNKLEKAITWIGFAVFGAMVLDKAFEYMEPKISATVDYVNEKIIKRVKDELK